MYCESVAMARKCQAVLNKKGMTYKTQTSTGSWMERKRPEIAILDTMMGHARRFAVEFGLTPVSQSKVNATPPPADDPMEDFLARGRPKTKYRHFCD